MFFFLPFLGSTISNVGRSNIYYTSFVLYIYLFIYLILFIYIIFIFYLIAITMLFLPYNVILYIYIYVYIIFPAVFAKQHINKSSSEYSKLRFGVHYLCCGYETYVTEVTGCHCCIC